MIACGVAAGIVVAWGLSRFIESMIYGLSATNVPTIALAVTVLVLTGLLAGLVPASKASRIDPHLALRND
jgi:ABC-type antimicrobial peptide transport system permease subunit